MVTMMTTTKSTLWSTLKVAFVLWPVWAPTVGGGGGGYPWTEENHLITILVDPSRTKCSGENIVFIATIN